MKSRIPPPERAFLDAGQVDCFGAAMTRRICMVMVPRSAQVRNMQLTSGKTSGGFDVIGPHVAPGKGS